MSGTNYPTGLVTRTKFNGSAAQADRSRLAANTKFISKTAVIRCDAQTSETQTGFTLPASAIVKRVFLNVITVDATETVDVGTQGTSDDPNGYLAAASDKSASAASRFVKVPPDGPLEWEVLNNEDPSPSTIVAEASKPLL